MEDVREKHVLSDAQVTNLLYLRALVNLVWAVRINYRGKLYNFVSSGDPTVGGVRCSLVPVDEGGQNRGDEPIVWFLCRNCSENGGGVVIEPTTVGDRNPVILDEPLYGSQAAWISDFLQNRGEWVLP